MSRLVMASEGQWVPEGDVPKQLEGKLAECLWWILVLADRLEIDIDDAFSTTLGDIETHLQESVGRVSEQD